jgi:hypothetical protein
VTSTDIVKTSSSVSPAESPSTPTTSDTIASSYEDEDTPESPPKRSWVKLNHPPQQILGTDKEGLQLRNKIIHPTNEGANQVFYYCYLA